MDRRNFIKSASIVGGSIFAASRLSRAEALKETPEVFRADKSYDIIIGGGSIEGCLLAVRLANAGKKVLVVERRHCLGSEITSTRKTWLNATTQTLESPLADLLTPEAECVEASNLGDGGKAYSPIDGEVQFFCGSVKKSLMRTLRLNGVDTLLCADIFGFIQDKNSNLCGVAFATRQGCFCARCSAFVDASIGSELSRTIFGLDDSIKKASFTAEFELAQPLAQKREVLCPKELGLESNKLTLRRSKKDSKRIFMEFSFPANSLDSQEAEYAARRKLLSIGRCIREGKIDIPEVKKAKVPYFAQECSLEYANPLSLDFARPQNFFICECKPPQSAAELNQIAAAQKDRAEKILALQKSQTETMSLKGLMLKSSSGDSALEDPFKTPLEEDGLNTPFFKLPTSSLHVSDKIDADVFVAGCGTAGVFAAHEAASGGARTVAAEFFNDTGGTRTMAGVRGYYRGQSKHPFVKENDSKIYALGRKNIFSWIAARALYNFSILESSGVKLLTGALVCGAKTEGGKISSVLLCQRGKLKYIKPKIAIDATADADLSAHASIPFKKGFGISHLTQNYSRWDLPTKNADGKYEHINKDYDIIDASLFTEFQRATILDHAEARFYDFYPFIGVRDARRPIGTRVLTLADCVLHRRFTDAVCTAKSDFDPHFFSLVCLSRMGLLHPHFDPEEKVYIPYGSLTCAEVDNLLFCGRGISQTWCALQFTRMSADIFLLGACVGIIAAGMIKDGVSTNNFDITKAQRILVERGLLEPDFAKGISFTGESLAAAAASGDDSALLRLLLLPKAEAMPYARAQLEKSGGKNLPCSYALCYWNDGSVAANIREELSALLLEEKKCPHDKDYYERYEQNIIYWRINRGIAALALAGGSDNLNDSAILDAFKGVGNVGKKVPNPTNPYYANRLDLCLSPNYNRLINLCMYARMKPSEIFIPELKRLAADAEVKNSFITKDASKTRWRLYQAILELSLASALARCGSESGRNTLKEYLNDVHSNFRLFARTELDQTRKGVKSPAPQEERPL